MSVVNLNKARKARARTEKKLRADANAVKFGRTKSEKRLTSEALEKAGRNLDGKKLD